MDNHHVNILGSSMSCGVKELSRIEPEYDKVIYALACDLYHPSRGSPCAFYMWSGPPEKSNAKGLYDALWKVSSKWKTHPACASNAVENPKTSNVIQVFIWEIPHEEFKAWYIEERVKRVKQL